MLPPHEESSSVYLTAKEIAKWIPIIAESNIEDSSFQLFLAINNVKTNTKVKVKPSNGVTGVNSGAIIARTIAENELRMMNELFSLYWSTIILPISAAKAAIIGRIRISAYPSVSIPPFATESAPKNSTIRVASTAGTGSKFIFENPPIVASLSSFIIHHHVVEPAGSEFRRKLRML